MLGCITLYTLIRENKYKVKDWFRKYATPEECFTDHTKFFFRYSRYKAALDVRGDHVAFIKAIATAGYATDPREGRDPIMSAKVVRINKETADSRRTGI